MARPFLNPSLSSVLYPASFHIQHIHQQLQPTTLTFIATSSSRNTSSARPPLSLTKSYQKHLDLHLSPRLSSFATPTPTRKPPPRNFFTSYISSRSLSNINWKPSKSLRQQQQQQQQQQHQNPKHIHTMTTPSNLDSKVVVRELVPGVTTLSIPFLRFDKIKFGIRATIVQIGNGLAVFSPIPITPVVTAHIKSLGLPVTYLIAPDIEHHMSLSAWAAAYPTAHIIAPEGLPEKRAQQNATNKDVTLLNFGTVFTVKDKKSPEGIKVTPEFDSQFHFELVDAHINKELVFVHKASKTLITADLLFNLPAHEQYSKSGESATTGIFTKIFTALNNTHGTAIWQKRMAWYVFSKADRPGFNASVQRINAWDFVNIVPSHGDSIVGDGKQIFEKVFGWHLNGKK